MSVIPQDELLLVSAKIQTHEIDQVFIGQPAVVRIGAFKQRITPELEATVTGISPDESKESNLPRPSERCRIREMRETWARAPVKRAMASLRASSVAQPVTSQ